MAGHLALQVTSLAGAKRLFYIETNVVAGFLAGLMNPSTSAFEMTALTTELWNCPPPWYLRMR